MKETTDVVVWYNLEPTAMLTGVKDDCSEFRLITCLRLTATRETDIEICERVFRLMNVVDGDELPIMLQVRSMSVGDMIEIDGRCYACENAGWKMLE